MELVGAEAAVGQDHVAFTEEVEALTKELAFMNTQITFYEVQKSAAGEAKASDQFGYREAAARVLISGLGPNALIFGVSGMETPVPSTTLTCRSSHSCSERTARCSSVAEWA
tara:strand:- start:91 stop:426 length:336 start_codon:yes stop_codon:yes gene_type:complete